MAKFSLRRFDTQARVSVYLSAASAVCLIALSGLLFRHPRLALMENIIPYKPGGAKMILIYLFGALAFGLGAAGFGFGLNSAGQRRNDKPAHSWVGFFLGAGSLTLSLALLFLFRKWGEPLLGR